MMFLLTNDDGIAAPGLAALQRAAYEYGQPITVAPLAVQSGCSHRVTTGQPFEVACRDTDTYAVDGTPADCVRFALHEFAARIEWVLSGINAGGNLGADVFYSGTVAAIREAALHGRHGIAFSQYIKRGQEVDWPRSAKWAGRVLEFLLQQPLRPGQFWNVNFPHLPPDSDEPATVMAPLEIGPLPLNFRIDGEHWHYSGDYHQRPRIPGSDVDICFNGNIAVTQLSL